MEYTKLHPMMKRTTAKRMMDEFNLRTTIEKLGRYPKTFSIHDSYKSNVLLVPRFVRDSHVEAFVFEFGGLTHCWLNGPCIIARMVEFANKHKIEVIHEMFMDANGRRLATSYSGLCWVRLFLDLKQCIPGDFAIIPGGYDMFDFLTFINPRGYNDIIIDYNSKFQHYPRPHLLEFSSRRILNPLPNTVSPLKQALKNV